MTRPEQHEEAQWHSSAGCRAEAKWNTIEHRLFSFITSNWRGKPLTELATIVNLIASTSHPKRSPGLSRLDEGRSPAKVKVSDAELEAIDLHGHAFHRDWHHTREPRGIRLPPPNSSC